MKPLKITAILGSPITPSAQTKDIRMDALLAFSIFQEMGHWTPKAGEDMLIPELPLLALWRDEKKPLWACSNMQYGEVHSSIYYRHRRWDAIALSYLKRKMTSIQFQTGRFKDKRIAYSVIYPLDRQVHWLAIGDKAEVERLLEPITSIGKHFSCYGSVLEWVVEEMDFSQDEIIKRRDIPVRSGLKKAGKMAMLTWTPPYHFRPWAEVCYVAE